MWIKVLFWWPSLYQKAVMSWEQDWSSPKFKKNKWATLLANPPLLKWSILDVYFKYTGSIFPKYIWSVLQLYLKHILNLLQVYFKYTSTCWVTEEEEEEEEVYFKSLLFRQKEYIWSTFVKLNWLNLKYTSSILELYLKCTF